MSFLFHSLFFLAELKATSSLPKVLTILSQSEEYLEFFLGDFLIEIVWETLYKLGLNKLELLKQFMLQPAVYTFSKTAVSEAVNQIVLHNSERKKEVVLWFKNIFNAYLTEEVDKNVIDSIVVGAMVADVIEINGKELLPIIKKLYKKELVDISYCGNFKDVEHTFANNTYTNKKDLTSLEEKYKEINSTWLRSNSDDSETHGINNHYEDCINETLVKDKTVRRNDPCPCGSGKKYKKCCLH